MRPRIDHVVVLMMENRSFDHMLGYLYPASSKFEGLRGTTHANPDDPFAPIRSIVPDDQASSAGLIRDGGHNYEDVYEQLFGVPYGTQPPPSVERNSGFVRNFARRAHDGSGDAIMKCFNPQSLPVLSALAQQFAVCDHWHSSVPGPTWPNRLFTHAATSAGAVNNRYRLYPSRTIFNNLSDAGYDWCFYMDGITSQAMAMTQLHSWKRLRFKGLGTFKQKAAEGRLPNYSFIEPQFFWWEQFSPPTDQHPPHPIKPGEDLIAEVYRAVRSSPKWNQTLLVITYDEHGGLYDHVHPPAVTPPGDAVSPAPPFNFDQLGVRVPAVLISPWIPAGTIVNDTLEHASIPATLQRIFQLPSFLNARDASAGTFERVVLESNRNGPRADTPQDIRDITDAAARAETAAMAPLPSPAAATGGISVSLSDANDQELGPIALNEYQVELLRMSRELAGKPPDDPVTLELVPFPQFSVSREVELNIRTFINSDAAVMP